MALSEIMALAFSKVGNVSGNSTENSAKRANMRITRPYTGTSRNTFEMNDKGASSSFVGSSASDSIEFIYRRNLF